MFHIIDPLLSPEEVARLQQLAKTVDFDSGRNSNPGFTKKNNLQPNHNDGGYKEASTIIQNGLTRNEYFRDFCIPKTMAPPMITKYEPGMHYGEHIDNATLPYRPAIRPDISCTVFISDPESYEGGDLNVRLGDKNLKIKGKAGSAILYPSTTYHQVLPVTKGERVVSITFIESMVRDVEQREILVELTEFMHANAAKVGPEEQMRLEYVRQNLTRMWYGS